MIGSVSSEAAHFGDQPEYRRGLATPTLAKALLFNWRYSIGPKIEVDFRKSTMRTFKNFERPLRVLEDARRSSVMRKPLSITFIVKKNRTGWSIAVRFHFFR